MTSIKHIPTIFGRFRNAWRELTRGEISAEAARNKKMLEATKDGIRRKGKEALEAKEASVIDPLTGLLDRKGATEEYERLFDRMAHGLKNAHCVVGAIFDLDHFKNVNDTFGHKVGDLALKHFAKILADSFRSTDIVCRWGGEEFVAIGAFPSMEKAKEHMDKIRLKLAQTPLKLEDGRSINLTVSAGLTSFNPYENDADIDTLIDFADKGLYTSKEEGRNRVTPVKLPIPNRSLSLEAKTAAHPNPQQG